jgi:hypothetical protein
MVRLVVGFFAGFLAIGFFSSATDRLVQQVAPTQYGPAGEVHSTAMLLLILGYTEIYCAAGGALAAIIASTRAASATIGLAATIVVLTLIDFAAFSPTVPLWWRVALAILAGPMVLLGGWLWWRRHKTPAAA